MLGSRDAREIPPVAQGVYVVCVQQSSYLPTHLSAGDRDRGWERVIFTSSSSDGRPAKRPNHHSF